MRKRLLSALLAAAMLLPLAGCSVEEPVMPVNTTKKTELKRPEIGEDYYGYVNFDYITHGQIPYDQNSIGTFDNIQTELKKEVSDLFDELLKKDSTDPFENALTEMYNQYLDTDARDKTGITPLLPAVGMVEECKSNAELVKAMGAIYQLYGVGSFFRFDVEPDFFDEKTNNLTLINFNSCGNMKENFTRTSNGSESMGELMEESLKALEVGPDEAKKRARNVVSLIRDIMYASLDSDFEYSHYVEKHFNPYTGKEFRELLSNVDVDSLFESFGFSSDRIIVYDVPQTQKINEVFADEGNLRALKDYVIYCTIFTYQNSLPPSVMKEFRSLKNSDKQLEKSAKNRVSTLLENELGIVYGKKTCTKEIMSAAEKMLEDIRRSCNSLISHCDRLSSDGKKKLLKKLEEMIFLIGYDKDYKMNFTITPASDGGNYLENAIAVNVARNRAKMSGLGQKRNRIDWGMSPVTVNAQYDCFRNTVVIPAAMLSKASFDPEWGEFTNLGRLGYVIAHEMNHGFDSNGVMFDDQGCCNEKWLSKEDHDAYGSLQEKAKEYYKDYKLLGVYKVDGDLTLSENLADLGAMQCLADIPETKEELQQLYEGAAVQWSLLCSVEEAVFRLKDDCHSPAEARTNAVVASTDKFYEAYDIKETDKMYVAPENRIKVW